MNDFATDHPSSLGALACLAEAPSTTVLCTDFDGTLSLIVEDPEAAVPLPTAAAVLGRLADRFATVAVVSGRPVTFLAAALADAGPRLRLYGVYGLEWWEDGGVRVAPEAEPWLAPAAEVAVTASRLAPPGVGVEAKGPALAIHWRRAPEAGAWAQAFATEAAARTGLVLQPGRRALELRPPLTIDKGAVVERLAAGATAACFAGDDAGDLPAFAALDRLAAAGMAVVRLAVADAETPPALVAGADVVVGSPVEALALLGRLADAVASGQA
jgi:trehalose 6-phosphate phosphatase